MDFIKNIPGYNVSSVFWMWFIPAAVLTFFFSYKMVKYAEVIIAKTKFGGAFIGGALVSVSTSLTELTTEIMQAQNNTPEIGLADDIGANFFSTFIIAVMCLFFIKQMFIKQIGTWTKISIFFSMAITLLAAIILGIGRDIEIGTKGKFVIGLLPFLFFIAYIVYIFLSYKYGEEDEIKDVLPKMSAKKGVIGFLIFSLFLLVAAFFLNIVVSGLKDTYSLKSESAGGIFLSMTTAMPEIVSLIVLLYNKQPIAGIGSIIGSHIFNLSLIVYGDFAYVNGAIVNHGQNIWEMATATASMLFLLGIFAIISKKIKSKLVYSLIPIAIISIYIISWILILTLN